MPKIAATGLEHTSNIPVKERMSNPGGAKCGALHADIGQIDPNLAHVISAWSGLSTDARRAILAIAEGQSELR
jgi:hypothetical protein